MLLQSADKRPHFLRTAFRSRDTGVTVLVAQNLKFAADQFPVSPKAGITVGMEKKLFLSADLLRLDSITITAMDMPLQILFFATGWSLRPRIAVICMGMPSRLRLFAGQGLSGLIAALTVRVLPVFRQAADKNLCCFIAGRTVSMSSLLFLTANQLATSTGKALIIVNMTGFHLFTGQDILCTEARLAVLVLLNFLQRAR